MISRERAVELVESLLAEEKLKWPSLQRYELAIIHVSKHEFGWIVTWNTAEFKRTRNVRDALIGSGPFLVDGGDGSIHHIPTTTYMDESWERLYLHQIKGIRPPDPLLTAVRVLVESAGPVAAMHHLRKQAPKLSLAQARAYVDALRDGAVPPEDLLDLTLEEERCPPLPIGTLAGPAA
ncbi:YrhB domain-containing protein [Kitasatospora sp. NPDC101183]|uniref:YrhB domain-containing protein n=1 Tax=Kitasatospora sp. NPDC101183 TaxID=3364100 RepID=UPI00380D3164